MREGFPSLFEKESKEGEEGWILPRILRNASRIELSWIFKWRSSWRKCVVSKYIYQSEILFVANSDISFLMRKWNIFPAMHVYIYIYLRKKISEYHRDSLSLTVIPGLRRTRRQAFNPNNSRARAKSQGGSTRNFSLYLISKRSCYRERSYITFGRWIFNDEVSTVVNGREYLL